MITAPLNLEMIRERLAATRGREFWRSLDELAGTPEFEEFLHREFPRQASEWMPGMSRRGFLRLAGASLALAGLTSCTSQPPEKLVPYVDAPEQSVPGKPLFYATAMQTGGYSMGLLATSQMGRPTKIEGNPDHPASLGATDAWAQASVLTIYDPDRSQTVLNGGAASTWEDFLAALRAVLEQQRTASGAGLRFLTETVTSPTLAVQLQAVQEAFPDAVWHQYEPDNRDNIYAGAALAFGEPVEPIYHLDQAAVIVSLDADLFGSGPGRVRYARDFANGRRAEIPDGHVRNRLYAVESTPTTTGAAADHRLPMQAGQVEHFARALANALGMDVAPGNPQRIPEAWIAALARDLQANQGASLIVVGEHQPPIVHALAHAIHAHLGSVGSTVTLTQPVVANPMNQSESLTELVDAMNSGEVEALLILGANPVYHAPADLGFAAALEQVPFSAHLGLYADETAAACHWHIPEAHYLEAWSDGRAYDGTVTIQQPLIEPLYGGRSAHMLVDALVSDEPRSDHEIVKSYWTEQAGEQGFDAFWQMALHDGVVAGSAFEPSEVTLLPDVLSLPATEYTPLDPADGTLEVNFRLDPSIGDGRFANNGWLQELPKPLTKVTWENAALLGPITAAALELVTGDVVEIDYNGRTVQAPVWIMPGHCDGAVTLHLGYGRARGGRVGDGTGFDANALRIADAPWFGAGATLRKIGSGHSFASTQLHHTMDGRDLVRVGTVEQYAEEPNFVHAMDPHIPEISLYPKVEYSGNAWGMTIDLNACNGCNACVTACQAENNIPVVGKEQVANGREMHWIRIDLYYEGDYDAPEMHHQPVLCMHCENAPCEVVCPVAATMHDAEGLNTMIYNRCVGTRYCSNNCPYKVRRFNFLDLTDLEESLALQRNPNVTVRARGVMEKCTYCTQRISAARIDAKLEGREIRDGEVVTACQAACPTRAITFGNLNDPESEVAKRKASPLNYGLLTELNTHPRTTYLAKLRNPNPELAEG